MDPSLRDHAADFLVTVFHGILYGGIIALFAGPDMPGMLGVEAIFGAAVGFIVALLILFIYGNDSLVLHPDLDVATLAVIMAMLAAPLNGVVSLCLGSLFLFLTPFFALIHRRHVLHKFMASTTANRDHSYLRASSLHVAFYIVLCICLLSHVVFGTEMLLLPVLGVYAAYLICLWLLPFLLLRRMTKLGYDWFTWNHAYALFDRFGFRIHSMRLPRAEELAVLPVYEPDNVSGLIEMLDAWNSPPSSAAP